MNRLILLAIVIACTYSARVKQDLLLSPDVEENLLQTPPGSYFSPDYDVKTLLNPPKTIQTGINEVSGIKIEDLDKLDLDTLSEHFM